MNSLFDAMKRLVPTLFGVSLISFFLIRMIPGDPVLLLIGERGADPETYQRMKEALGLHKSVLEQYFIFITNFLTGDLGESIISHRPVWEEFIDRFPATLELSLCAMIFAFVFGVPLGVIAGIKRNKFTDLIITSSSLTGYSMPIFWWAIILISFFSVSMGLTPVSGRIALIYEIPTVTGFMLIDSWFADEPVQTFLSSLRHLILPTFALGTIPLAIITRMSRSSILEVISQDYVRTAKAKGASDFKVIFVHALKNALLPIITVAGLTFGSLITGAILTETIFSWPGIGKWIVTSVQARDYPVIQSGVMLIASLVVMTNFFVDALYKKLDPRIKN